MQQLTPGLAIEPGGAHQPLFQEGAGYELLRPGRADPRRHRLEAQLPVIFERCTEGSRLALQGFEPQAPPLRCILAGQVANLDDATPIPSARRLLVYKDRSAPHPNNSWRPAWPGNRAAVCRN